MSVLGRGRLSAICAAMLCLGVLAGCGAAGPASRPATSAASTPVTSAVKRADFLNGVWCTAPNSCIAVGSYYYGAGPRRTLVERWNGSTWRVERLPADARDGSLTAISCAGPSSCTAVGSPAIGWNGRIWRVERRTSPFDAVSCPTASSCVAVGTTSAGAQAAGMWNGRAWRAIPMPALPSNTNSVTLAGVSCSAPGACLAVGDYWTGVTARPNSHSRDLILAEFWNGTRWRIGPSLNVARRDRLSAVTCLAGNSCLAVGSVSSKTTLAQWWNGKGWRVQRTPEYNRIGYSELTGVSCLTPSHCVAVGDYNLGVPFAESYNGSAWTISRMAAPPVPRATQGLTVSCRPAGCEAAGTVGGETFAESFNGTSWRLQPTPDPR